MMLNFQVHYSSLQCHSEMRKQFNIFVETVMHSFLEKK